MPITLQKSNQLKSIAILMMLFLHLFNRDYTGLFQPLLFVGNQPLSYYISLFCDALHTIAVKRLSCPSPRDKDDASREHKGHPL